MNVIRPNPAVANVAVLLPVVLASSLGASAAMLDFEFVQTAPAIEGTAIADQFQPHYAMSFRSNDGSTLYIGKRGGLRAAFTVTSIEPPAHDTIHPDESRRTDFGSAFLTEDGLGGKNRQIIISYSSPVAQASGYLLDVDGAEQFTLTSYSDDGVTAIDSIVIKAGDSFTGDGRPSLWSFDHFARDIRQIRIQATGASAGTGDPIAIDNLECGFKPPRQQSASLEALIQTSAGVAVFGEVGRPYRIECADQLAPNTWLPLTNVFLPTSPYIFIDTAAPSPNRRFYRAISLP